jgi:hypothetical protein
LKTETNRGLGFERNREERVDLRETETKRTRKEKQKQRGEAQKKNTQRRKRRTDNLPSNSLDSNRQQNHRLLPSNITVSNHWRQLP